MTSELLVIRRKIVPVLPEGLPAIRLVGLKPIDDEQFMRTVEEAFQIRLYQELFAQYGGTIPKEERKSIIRAIFQMKQRFVCRRYEDRPTWFDIIPQNMPPGVLRVFVPVPWLEMLASISNSLGYRVTM